MCFFTTIKHSPPQNILKCILPALLVVISRRVVLTEARQPEALKVFLFLFLIIRIAAFSEKAKAPSTLAWKIPWMEEPGGLQSMWSRRVRHD